MYYRKSKMNKIKADFIKKYIEVDDFVRYCKSNRVDISKYELETYEKKRIVFPYYIVSYS